MISKNLNNIWQFSLFTDVPVPDIPRIVQAFRHICWGSLGTNETKPLPQNSPEQLTTLVGKSVGSGEGTRQYPLKVLSASQVGHTQRTHRNLPWMSCILKFRSLKIPLVEPSFSHGQKTEISREASWDALKIYVQLPYYRKLRYWKLTRLKLTRILWKTTFE